jgi:hydroxyethylthiazole kinase
MLWNDTQGLKENMGYLLDKVKADRPLVHQITNFVTANDCANMVLAIGGSPVMAIDQAEAEEIVSPASCLVLNLGTLTSDRVTAMLLAGMQANRLGIPVVLDPVGAGASSLRTRSAEQIAKEIKLAVVRGNGSELRALAGLRSHTRGVESAMDLRQAPFAKQLAEQLGCVVAATGAQDVVTDGRRSLLVNNGDQWLTRITGTGCMATALVGACCGVSNDYLLAAATALTIMGIAGEKAAGDAAEAGNGTFRTKLFDHVSCLSSSELKLGAKIVME